MQSEVIEIRADSSKATKEISQFNDGMTNLERKMLQTAQRARAAWDEFTAATVRALRAARDATRDFLREHSELLRNLALVGYAAVKHEITLQKISIAYRLVRLAINPYLTGLVLAAEAVSILTLRQAKLIETQAKAAAQARLTAREYQQLENVAAVSGQGSDLLLQGIDVVRSNPGVFRTFGVETSYGAFGSRSPMAVLAEAQARLGRIADPFERARQRQTLGLPDDLRFDLQESSEAESRYGIATTTEGAVALDRLRRAADGLATTFGDLWRNTKLGFRTFLAGGAEGAAIFVDRVATLGTVGQQQEELRRQAQGRSGDAADRFESAGRGLVSVLAGPNDATLRDEALASVARQLRRGGAPTFVGGPSESALREDLRLSGVQRAKLEQEEERRKEEAKRESEEMARAQKRASEILSQVRAKEAGEVAQIRQKYEQYRIELGKTAKAVDALRTAEALEIAAFVKAAKDAGFKAARASAATRVEEMTNERMQRLSADSVQFERRIDKQSGVDANILAAQQQLYGVATAPDGTLEAVRDSRLRQLDTAGINARSLQQKQAIEEQRLAIETEFLQQSSRLKAEQLKRDFDFEISSLEVQYQYKLVSEEQFQARKAALTKIQEINQARLGQSTQQQVDAARENSIQRQTQLYQQQASTIRASFESTIDALISRTRSAGSIIMSILQAAFVAPAKQFAAEIFTAMAMGGRVSGGGFGGPFTGGFAGGSGGGRYMGGLSAVQMLGGGGGFGGFTPGFAGGAGGGSKFGLASLLSGYKGMFYNSGSISLGAGGATTAAGIGGVPGALAGFATSTGGLLAGGLLGMDGLRRGGLLGLGESIGGGALTGAALGTMVFPGLGTIAGAAIGAAVGGIAGLFRLGMKGAEQKAIDKVKEVYGVTINKELARVIVEQAKQYGGIDIAVTMAQVRELVELYAMATGQRIGAGASVRPVNLVQNSGGIYQMPQSIAGQSYAYASPFATYGGAKTQTMPGPTVINVNLDPNQTQTFWQKQQLSIASSQPIASQQATSAPLEWTPRYAG